MAGERVRYNKVSVITRSVIARADCIFILLHVALKAMQQRWHLTKSRPSPRNFMVPCRQNWVPPPTKTVTKEMTKEITYIGREKIYPTAGQAHPPPGRNRHRASDLGVPQEDQDRLSLQIYSRTPFRSPSTSPSSEKPRSCTWPPDGPGTPARRCRPRSIRLTRSYELCRRGRTRSLQRPYVGLDRGASAPGLW